MTDIFVSYAQTDNLKNESIQSEITDVVNHFLSLYNHLRQKAGRPLAQIFFDNQMRAGDSIPERIRQAIDESSVMIAFYSPSYFRSRYCREEYHEFKRTQQSHGPDQEDKLLIPVEVHPVVVGELLEGENSSFRAWVDELVGAQGIKKLVGADQLRDKDTTALLAALRSLEQRLHDYLPRRRGTSEYLRRRTNVFSVEAKIVGSSIRNSDVEREITGFAEARKFPNSAPVLVVYTGGTIGMVHETDTEPAHGDFKIAETVQQMTEYIKPRLSSLPFDVILLGMSRPIDSSNVTANDWTDLARLLAEEMDHYQGFVVLHGTNTLAYTASALSFLLENVISKPVILTGAEVPLSVENTDAINNIENAIRAAGWQARQGPLPVPEVCIYWNTHLFRGNRTTKLHASDRATSFHTPNLPAPLAVLENERLRVNADLVWPVDSRSARQGARIVDTSGVRIDIAFIHPQMNIHALRTAYQDGIDGLILLSYGPGNVPDDEDFTGLIRELVSRGTTVCNVTQCPYGRVELKLFETNAVLFDMGVIDGYDLTTEAAYGKLLWAIARNAHFGKGKLQQVKSDFQRCVAGEMSATIEDVSFGSSQDFGSRDGYLVSQPQPLQAGSKFAVLDAFVRIEGIKVHKSRKGCRIRVFMDDRDPSTSREESLIAEFERTFSDGDYESGAFSKNLHVTHGFRKWYPGGKTELLLTTADGGPLEFNSMRLVVFSRPMRP